jgi:hypothetical protein
MGYNRSKQMGKKSRRNNEPICNNPYDPEFDADTYLKYEFWNQGWIQEDVELTGVSVQEWRDRFFENNK